MLKTILLTAFVMTAGTLASVAAQQQDEAAEAEIVIGSEEFRALGQNGRIDVMNRTLQGRISELAALYPALLEEGRYEYAGDKDALSDLKYRLNILRSDLKIGGGLRNLINQEIETTEETIREFQGDGTIPQEILDSALEELGGQEVRLQALRDNMNSMEQALGKFVNEDASAMQREYDLMARVERGREVIRNFEELSRTVDDLLQATGTEPQPRSGSD